MRQRAKSSLASRQNNILVVRESSFKVGLFDAIDTLKAENFKGSNDIVAPSIPEMFLSHLDTLSIVHHDGTSTWWKMMYRA